MMRCDSYGPLSHLSELVYENGLQAADAAVEARPLHTADSQDGRMQMGDGKGCAVAYEGSHGLQG